MTYVYHFWAFEGEVIPEVANFKDKRNLSFGQKISTPNESCKTKIEGLTGILNHLIIGGTICAPKVIHIQKVWSKPF